MRREILRDLKRVVIKIGSSILTHREGKTAGSMNGLNAGNVRRLAGTIRQIVDQGSEVVLVSSGAIMAGRERLGLHRVNLTIPQKQACAAIGQSYLMHTYEKNFEKQGFKVAQILLGHDDLENRKRFLNAKHTLEALLEHKVIPVINENDSVTVDEIKIGDNDTLSATVACLVDAQLLIILSDVEGLYSRDPAKKGGGKSSPPELIEHVNKITDKIEKLAGKSKSSVTVGGMYTKVLAAKQTMSFGIPTLVVNGLDETVADRIFAGESVGTLFWAGREKIKTRKHWIAHTLKPSGKVIIDSGARKALVERDKSLLPAGVVRVEGKFEFGNAVRIIDDEGTEIARGLVNYNFRDLDRIKGMKTSAVRKLFGENFYEEVIHRDDLVVL
ncbi:glutamate 5-kinase [Candidatus Nitromaritima sp. SCGC AAA799-A02]|nr:glutamate 5-kinase [Candidatus Nitromaritima sp. SCGC AAA799-C22]KMP11854.1 glutamate 5-kinase [Candidatus Nitromaritima sp. SCGC AAA799-A02]